MEVKVETVGTVKTIACPHCGDMAMVLVFGDPETSVGTAYFSDEEEVPVPETPVRCRCGAWIGSLVGDRVVVIDPPLGVGKVGEFVIPMTTASVVIVPNGPPLGPYKQDAIRIDLKPGTHIYRAGTPENPILVLRRGLSTIKAEGEGS